MSNRNDCKNRREAIAAFVLGELETPAADELRKHIDVCEVCRNLYQALAGEEETIRSAFKAITDRTEMTKERLVKQFDKHSPQPLLRGPVALRRLWTGLRATKQTTKIAAAIIIAAISFFSWFIWQQHSSNGTESITCFSLLKQAWAAEQILFSQDGIVHITNEIIVQPTSDAPKTYSADQPDLSEARVDYKWLPMCSLQATGDMRFNQLQLPSGNKEACIITDESWYDSATGRFARVMRMGKKVFFANSYDGEYIYSSETATDGTFRLVKTRTAEEFRPPKNPAEFLGPTAGFRSRIQEEKLVAPLQGVRDGTLTDGTSVRIIKIGSADPYGNVYAYWLFKIRNDDGTIGEMEFVIGDQPQLLIRRVLSETVAAPNVSWNLTGLEEKVIDSQETPGVAVKPDMVIPDVSVQHMIDRASFETYIFATKPSWTGTPEITDCFDPASPGHRMFFFASRASDGRHLVLVQSQTYNKTLGSKVKQCQLIYTSPNGFKVWRGGPEKWLADILLRSATAVIKDPPADDRTCYVLESPAGTFPTLAINGQLSDEELHGLIDSLIPAKEYQNE